MKKSRDKHPALRFVHHIFQAIPIYFFYGIFTCLPLKQASALGGWLGRNLGPLWGVTRRAEKNIAYVLPETTEQERKKIIHEMWDNLGRNVAEAPHLRAMVNRQYITVEGRDHLEAACALKKPIILLSGHFANWETTATISLLSGLKLAVIYRKPNNPFADWLVRYIRRETASVLLPKGPDGARGLMRHLREGKSVGMLVDQKMNNGIELSFMGKPAMTTIAPATMGIKTDAVLLPIYSIRENGAYFRIKIGPQLQTDPALPLDAQIRDLTQQTNDLLGAHIRAFPGQWLWLHRRWGRI